VRGAARQRPLLHRLRDLVGELDVEALAAGDGLLQAVEGVLGEVLLLDAGREDVRAVEVEALGQVGGAQTAVRLPLVRAWLRFVLLEDGFGRDRA
jgi:hypothetical protein